MFVSCRLKNFTLHIKITQIRLIDQRILIFQTELLLKVRMIGEHQVISGSVKDLSILTGVYNPEKRADWIYQVLRPCSISIAGSTPENKGLHVDVCCTDVHISVSPGDIKIPTKYQAFLSPFHKYFIYKVYNAAGVIEILNRVMKKITTKEPDADENVKHEPTHEGLWLVSPYEETDYWFLKTEVGIEVLEEFSYEEADEVVPYKAELAIVSAPVILLTLEAGVGNKTLPMLLFNVGFQSNVNDWSTKTVRTIMFFS